MKRDGHSTMDSEPRAELLVAIAEMCQRYPHWRLGQLVASIAGWADKEIWDVEDHQLLAAANAHLQQMAPLETAPAGRTTR